MSLLKFINEILIRFTDYVTSLNLDHKHLPEMKKFTDLDFQPVSLPTVSNYYIGMVVTVPLVTRLLINQPSLQEIHAALTNYYQGETFVRVIPLDDTKGISQYALDPTRFPIIRTNYPVTVIILIGISFISRSFRT